MDETFTRRELLAAGWTGRALAAAVSDGHLLRVRRGHYARRGTAVDVLEAVRVGGRVTCVSELRFRGIWTPEISPLHIHLDPHAARLRDPHDCRLHWSVLRRPDESTAAHVGLIDALLVAVRCLSRWWAVAAIDSILNQGLHSEAELARAFSGEPVGIRALLDLADPRADSGLETFVRILARALGFRVAIQVRFAGIGIADVVVEDWIVVETDGRSIHDTPVVSARDRRRDARHAAAGRTPLRFRYAQVVYDLPTVAEAIIGAVRSHRRVRNSGELARRAEIRLARLDLS
jgi:very-short-patch-repair endonuclease